VEQDPKQAFRQAGRPDLAGDEFSSAWVERGDLRELHVRAPSVEQVFAGAAVALGRALAGEEPGAPDRLPILVEAPDLPALLVEFLDDVVYLAVVERFAARRVERLSIEGTRLRAAVSGQTGPTRPAVTAVRLERSGLERDGEDWVARVLLRGWPGVAHAARGV
jgi:SHS2 domain-containing protein